MLRHFYYISLLIVFMTTRLFSQQTWIPFQKQEKMPPEVSVIQSDNNAVSFSVRINGMLSTDKKIGAKNYQRLSIPNSEVMTSAGEPALPVITKLVAVPDCDDITITVSPSNEIHFSDYSVIPAPKYEKQVFPDGSHNQVPVYEEDASIYSSDLEFPSKDGEIIETGYVRSQKVVQVIIYPIHFNPAKKTLKAFTDFQIKLSFSNSTSSVNKELGIFRNMMHHAAINYELSGISASTRGVYPINGNQLGKTSVTSGSVNRVTNLDLLVDPTDPMPVDYLIITHSDLYNSTYLTNLANHRSSYNGYDVVIVHVDDVDGPPPNLDCVYEFYPSANNYESIRNFIADVYANGAANHTHDGHLGYIVLVGDANYDNTTVMLPASREYSWRMWADPEIAGEYVGYGCDYYYACVTHSGGIYDDVQDLMYGRISVGNDGELSNVVNKIIDYEKYASGAWRNNIAFMSFSPWFFDDDSHCDDYFLQMSGVVPQSCYISYSWRGFAADTEPDLGRQYFTNHPTAQMSNAVIPDDVDEMWYRRYTGWRWYDPSYPPDQRWRYGGEYADANNYCGALEIDDWFYEKMNSGLHTFVYEGHGRQASLGAGEGTGRTIFCANDIASELSNYRMYSFIISNSCETGYFDATDYDHSTYQPLRSIDCIAERAVNLQNAGAIGFLGSARTSYTGAFNHVDRYILEAEYNHLSHVMGEAVMESKLRLTDLLYRRQYNLYGDPAVNLFPYGYTISEDLTLSGTNDITSNLTVASGVTLTIQTGATLVFHPGASLTINGTLTAQGTSADHITFTSSNASPQKGDWEHIKFDNSSGTSTLEYCDIEYAEIGIWCMNSSHVNINHVSVENCSNWGIYLLNNNNYTTVEYSSFININDRGIFLYNSSPQLNHATCSNNNYGLFCYSSSSPQIGFSTFSNNNYDGVYCSSSSSPWMYYQSGFTRGWNNISNNTGKGVTAYSSSYPKLGFNSSSYPGKNTIQGNGSYEIYNGNSSGYVWAIYNWWETSTGPLFGDLYTSSTVKWQPVHPPSTSLAKVLSTSPGDDGELDDYYNEKGTLYLANGDYNKAKEAFEYVINEFPDSLSARYALVHIPFCFNGMKSNSEVVPYLEDVSLKNKKKNDLEGFALSLTIPYLEKEGRFQEAAERCQQVRGFYQDKEINKNLLFILGNIYYYGIQDYSKASTYFNQYVQMYPDDPMAETAQYILKDLASKSLPKEKQTKDPVTSPVPKEFTLSQNYPNPFNPETQICYQLPEDCFVTLVIYNMLGQKIRTLVNHKQIVGSYTVLWNGKDDNGSSAASGLYLYQLNAGRFNKVNKMVLLR